MKESFLINYRYISKILCLTSFLHIAKNYSCETTLLRLTEDWRAGLDNKELVAVISLPIQGL